jgi:hypothetical protein
VGRHEPPRFDRVFHDRERPSGVHPGNLEHHPPCRRARRHGPRPASRRPSEAVRVFLGSFPVKLLSVAGAHPPV